ncbi:MAG: NAD(P)H-binding protein, partial [Limosilactobacillus sp.]
NNFDVELEAGDILCWLPQVNDPVDDEVQQLAALIDRSLFPPQKIVMLSIAGTADDADETQLKKWYGKRAMQAVWAHQYAIKMIDELELPYVVVRALPLGKGTGQIQVVDEGQPLAGENISEEQLATVLETALTTGKFDNHSIGVMPSK